MEMNAVAAVWTVLERTKRMASSRSSSSSSFGGSDNSSIEELPYPTRNLTVSRVVIMVISLTQDSQSLLSLLPPCLESEYWKSRI